MVALGRTDEALVVAERGRTRAFVDLLLERQQLDGAESWYASVDSAPVTREQILDIVAKQHASVLYFSVAAGFLYSWLITPQHGKKNFEIIFKYKIWNNLKFKERANLTYSSWMSA